jgi:nucleotide-binding universal stress UspA family protein
MERGHDTGIALLHAYRVPFEGLLGKEAHRDEMLQEAERLCAAFLAEVPAATYPPERLERLFEYGSPDQPISAFVWDRDADLAVVGTHGSSGVFDILIGSAAERLVEDLPCDVLVVRNPRALRARG